jgi:hypothetical protein
LSQAVTDVSDLLPGFNPGLGAFVIEKIHRPLIFFQFRPVNLGKQGEGDTNQSQQEEGSFFPHLGTSPYRILSFSL